MVDHPGTLLQGHLILKGMSQKVLSYEMCINPATVSLLIAGKRDINPELAVKLGKIFDTPAIAWLYWQAEYDLDKELRRSK